MKGIHRFMKSVWLESTWKRRTGDWRGKDLRRGRGGEALGCWPFFTFLPFLSFLSFSLRGPCRVLLGIIWRSLYEGKKRRNQASRFERADAISSPTGKLGSKRRERLSKLLWRGGGMER